ncbi:SDR family NAD(P)-dependent oxidoreductase [Nostoc sp. MG11]|uniref:SDR family NAD(P)-dependent oxidoreductase n=1 Tax=Nostoc sp. MG11 TaxID=2721166 RepID=UPI00186610BE|nr:SDR family oxidoreductase [Nostoc sp. MG11]
MQLSKGHIWLITEGGEGVGIAVAEKLHQQGQKAVILKLPTYSAFNQQVAQTNIDVINLNNSTELHIKETLETIQEQVGLIGGFIHTHPLAQNVLSSNDLFQEQDKETVKLVFLIAKHLKLSLNNACENNRGNAYFVTVTKLDGEMGTSGKKACAVIGGGLSGLVKSLNREWANVCCRYIDLESSINIKEAANIVMEEIADTNLGLLEVGRNQVGERITLTTERIHNLSYLGKTPDSQSVFLVSGGGRGITADCVAELAKAYKSKFILLGRTVLQPHEPEWANNCTDHKEFKKLIINDFIQQGKKPTPIEVDKVLHDLISQRDIRNSLKQIKQYGGEAIYLSVNVTQKLDLAKQIEKLPEHFKNITGIIHGAGNIADKRIEKKTEEDFNRVFEPKIKGLENLLSIVNLEELKYVILFSSVSGYFGNAGQTDYALANDVLNKFAYSFKHLFPKIRIVSINWGPWDRGMISPTLKKFYQESNIDLIPVDIGIKFCRDELRISKDHAVEQILVSGKLSLPSNHQIEQINVVESKRIMQQNGNPFIKDHVIGKNAVLPATCAVNWMVKSSEDVLPNHKVRAIENFQVLKGIVFDEQYQEEYLARITLANAEDNVQSFVVKISSQPKDKNNSLYHYGATLFFEKEWGSMPIYGNLDIKSDGKTYKTYQEGSGLFHGKNFQGIKKVLQISDRKITSLCNLPTISQKQQGQFTVNSFNPFLGDVQLQGVLIWTYYQLDNTCLPMGFEKFEQFQALDFDTDFYVSTEIVSFNKSKLTANIFVHNEHGEIYIRWLEVSYIMMKNLQALYWEKGV